MLVSALCLSVSLNLFTPCFCILSLAMPRHFVRILFHMGDLILAVRVAFSLLPHPSNRIIDPQFQSYSSLHNDFLPPLALRAWMLLVKLSRMVMPTNLTILIILVLCYVQGMYVDSTAISSLCTVSTGLCLS